MIKRRFYKQEHVDKNDDVSDSSSSESDSEVEAREEETDNEEEEIEAVAEEAIEDEKPSSPSSGSGYASEDSSGDEVDVDSSGLVINDDDEVEKVDAKSKVKAEKGYAQADFDGPILKCKSVFKCRLCPRIVCLTEETLKAHLKSKRHARSEKLLNEGRLKLMLNSDGEEECQETHAERHARIVALAQNLTNPNKKNKGRQRQRQRKRLRVKKAGDDSKEVKEKQSLKNPSKKRRINRD